MPLACGNAAQRSLQPACVQGIKLPESLRASGDLDAVVAHGQLLLMVVPTPFVASTMSSIRDQLRPEQARQPYVHRRCSAWPASHIH